MIPSELLSMNDPALMNVCTDTCILRTGAWLLEGLCVELPTRHGAITMFSHDTGALASSLLCYGEWAENEIRLLNRLLPLGGTVIDVGAFIGTHSLAFAEAVGQSGSVFAFEAQAASFTLLVNNLKANNVTHVKPFWAAVGNAEGSDAGMIWQIDIGGSGNFGGTSVTAVSELETSEARRVPWFRLDKLDLARLDLIKIDAEGMEADVLAGAAALLLRHQPVVYAECNSIDAGARVIKQLTEAGMHICAHVVRAFNPDNWYRNSKNIFGGAIEVALLGIPERHKDHVAHAANLLGERVLPIETLDDLVFAMSVKPQYAHEVLNKTAACRSWLGAASSAAPC
ncbi:MAG: FkbM family methyltransferase [Rhodospirillales bacterium]|nr:FkbM family methyltransferase [Rhodospirillales bacterium]